jgi:DNA anti-recombination protein RmuC
MQISEQKRREEFEKQIMRKTDRIERSLHADREDIDKLQQDMTTVKAQNERIIEMIKRLEDKIHDTINDSMTEVTNPMEEKLDKFVDKTVVRLDKEQVKDLKGINWFQRAVRRWRK